MEENLNLAKHTSQRFNEELEGLRSRILTMGGLVEQRCEQALSALLSTDAELARRVARSDCQVNDLEIAISAQCTDILALRQPAASDLRLVVAIIRMAANLERIGDEAAKIARMALKLADDHDRESYEPQHLGDGALSLLHGALDAFARLDVQSAIDLISRDEELDQEFKSLTRLLITHMMEQPQRIKSMLRVNTCARALERIGDHAVNLCEEVVYLVKGADIRHSRVEEVRQFHQP